MCSKKTDVQQWSIRAEFTVGSETHPSVSSTLLYCWRTSDGATKNSRSSRNNLYKPVEYQKGSLTFTSTPPHRLQNASGCNFEVHDSGYGSDLLPLNSIANPFSQNSNNENNRKCRSTCNIILCNNICNKEERDSASSSCGKCKCQKAKNQCTIENSNCDFTRDFINPNKDKKIQHPISTHLKTNKKDVSIQTSESLQACSVINAGPLKKHKLRRPDKTNINNCNTSANVPSSTRHSCGKLQEKNSPKKPHTIHIDVYCTDTDIESETTVDSSENDVISATKKVFETKQSHVKHKRAKNFSLPFRLKNKFDKLATIDGVEKYDSETDSESNTSYLSKMDSYSVLNYASSSQSSVKSWKNNKLKKWNSCKVESDPLKICNKANENQPIPKTPKTNLKDQDTSKIITHVIEKQNCTGKKSEKVYTKHEGQIPKKTQYDVKSFHENTNDYPKDIMKTSNSSFPVLPGQYTEQIASRYGPINNLLKKPGHHIGPTKNPDCCCDHCKRYFNK